MDRQRTQWCLEQVAAYRASGQKAKAWCEANGMELGTLGSWCAHSKRWQDRLDGASVQAAAPLKPSGFVAAHRAPSAVLASVRVEVVAGAARLELHWPLAHTIELAAWVRELGR